MARGGATQGRSLCRTGLPRSLLEWSRGHVPHWPLNSLTHQPLTLTGPLLTGPLLTGHLLTGHLLTGPLLTGHLLTGPLLTHGRRRGWPASPRGSRSVLYLLYLLYLLCFPSRQSLHFGRAGGGGAASEAGLLPEGASAEEIQIEMRRSMRQAESQAVSQ